MSERNTLNLNQEVENLRRRGVALPVNPARAALAAHQMHNIAATPGDLRNMMRSPNGASLNQMEENTRLARAMGNSRRTKARSSRAEAPWAKPTKTASANAGYGVGDTAMAIPRFYDPLEYWDITGLPWNMADEGHRHKLHKWLRLYYATHYLVPILIDIFTRFPLVGMSFESKDQKLADFYEDVFMNKLDYQNFLVDLGREFWLVGEAYPLGHFSETLGVWEAEELLNPEDVIIKNFPLLGSSQMYIVPPDYLPLSVDSSIQMGDGSIVKLGTIKKGQEVITHKGRARRVLGVYEQGKLPGLRLTTQTGRSIDTAYDHPFLTPDGWIAAKDLVIGNVLGLVVSDDRIEYPKFLEEYRLLGYFVGDGCCAIARKNKNGTETCASYISCFDPIEGHDVVHCAQTLGFETRVSPTKINISANKTSKVQDWLRQVGLHGKNCYTKRIPEFVFHSSNEQIANFIGAYFACDGCISFRSKIKNHVTVSISSVNRALLEDTRYLLLRLGIKSKIYLHKGTGLIQVDKDYPVYESSKISWTLTIYAKDDIAKFASVIPVYGVKKDRLLTNGNVRQEFSHTIIPDQIKSIEDIGEIECRCLQVEEDSSFTANDFAVHNTKLAKEKSPAKEYKQLEIGFPELIPYLLKNEHIPVSGVLLKQIANKHSAWDDHGTPHLLRVLRTLMHEEKLLASQDAIAERLYSPFILARLGIMDLGDGQPPFIPDPQELDMVRDEIDIALSSDFRLMVHHLGIEIENVFGREQMPRLGDDFDRIERRILQSFGVNPSLLSAGSATQPYASSALQAEFLNQILKTFQGYLIKHYESRAKVMAEVQEHYDYTMNGSTKVTLYEEIQEFDDEGNETIITKPKLLYPKMVMQTLDLRDEATERQFLQSLRAMGVPISNQRLMVGVNFDVEDEVDDYNEELIKQTVKQQESKFKAYTILRERNLPIPPDLQAEVEGVLQPGQTPGGGMDAPGGGDKGGGPPPAGPGGPIAMPPPPAGLLGPEGMGGSVPGGGPPPTSPQGAMGPGGGSTAPPVSMERRKGMPQASVKKKVAAPADKVSEEVIKLPRSRSKRKISLVDHEQRLSAEEPSEGKDTDGKRSS